MIHLSTLAQSVPSRREQLQPVSGLFDQDASGAVNSLLTVFSLLAALVGILWLLHRLQQRRLKPAAPKPMALYRRTLRKLRLPIADRWRLRRLAHAVRIEQPTALLIAAPLYDAAVKRYCAGSGLLASLAGAAPAFAAIRRRLFGTTTG